ncbi:protein phosphatase 2C domain-containing protein [Streptomyces sp. TRM76323]|uniref:Protein phosphatase 2C domain-containing protein n=1 Tax=Streptomyces tamarix TaxID=3078565 RepID=A0ABU3QSP6_9ACTN|nr:protein phosphatase 2C domain-containing protein [Streptomyces tamarix]MDT9685402.1 protein phosphatase 2C domain-containing protein [Streptomyces tamarix]
MNPQGDEPSADDWWERLYGDPAAEAAPAATGDTLDDRYASASSTLTPPPALPAPPPPRRAPSDAPPCAPAPREARPTPGPRTAPGGPRPARPAPGGPAPDGRPAGPRPPHARGGAPAYDPEPTALPPVRPGGPADPVPDTVLDGARYGTFTLRAASTRGDAARSRGEPRRDALLTARFGAGEGLLVMVAVATGARAGAEDAHRAAGDACRRLGEAVGRHHERLARDIAAGRREDLGPGLRRLTDHAYGGLRARAAGRGAGPGTHPAGLHCLLLGGTPGHRTRIFFGTGAGGLFRLRGGVWQDLAPPPAVPFRFRASVARPGDTLLLAGGGLAEPLRHEPALARELAARWASADAPPGLAAFLTDTRLGAEGYADDRTAVALWEA